MQRSHYQLYESVFRSLIFHREVEILQFKYKNHHDFEATTQILSGIQTKHGCIIIMLYMYPKARATTQSFVVCQDALIGNYMM